MAKEIEKRFVENVKVCQKLALSRKEITKKREAEKTLQVLDVCKSHGGPVSISSLHLLDF